MNPLTLTLDGAAQMLASGELSSVELTEAALARIAALEPKIHAFLRVDAGGARAMAAASDARRSREEARSPLDGVPVALKDLFCQEGSETTAGSKILVGFKPPYDSTAVARLKAAGAVLVGKLAMDEFAMGSSNENTPFERPRNPWDLERVPGGSSGGSAAAVAAREVFGTLGTDTGGSIRLPAALCGVAGLKPTYGRVSRYGVVAFASSLDQVGPLGRSVRDCAHLLQVIAGHDPLDSTSADQPVPDYLKALGDLKGLRLGVPREYFGQGLDPEVERSVRAALQKLADLGATLVDISLPHTEYGIAAYYIVATAEASSNLARFDGVKYGYRAKAAPGQAQSLSAMYLQTRGEGFGPEVRRRILLGTYVLSAGYYDAYYRKAQKVIALIKRDFREAFGQVDAIVGPTSPTAAFRLGEKAANPLAMYLADVFTVACNLAGLPGLSLPCGFTDAGLPIGLQILGKAFDERTLFRVALPLEDALDLTGREPHP